MAISKLTDVSTYIPKIFEDAAFVARETNLMSMLVRLYSASGFMARELSKYAQATAVSVNDAQDFASPTTLSKASLATLTPGEIITQYLITDQMWETDPQDAIQAASVEIGGSIATKVDVDLVGSFSSFATDLGPGAGSAADLQSFADCMAKLRTNLARPPIYAVVHPYHWHDIWAELGQPAATYAYLGDEVNTALRDWFMGNWLGAEWFLSANIAIDASDDAVSGVFNRDALALDTRRMLRIEPERDASLRATELNGTMGYAYGVKWNTYGMYYTADASAPT